MRVHLRLAGFMALTLAVATCTDQPTAPEVDVAPTPSFGVSPTTFSDATFENADWSLAHLAEPAPPFGVFAMQRSNTLGNPDPFFSVLHTLGGTPTPAQLITLHLKVDAVHDPAVDGEIATVSHAEDARTIQTEPNTFGAGSRALLEQDGSFYASSAQEPTRDDPSGPLPSPWKTIELDGLTAADFCLVTGPNAFDCSTNPDFTASGAPITFGFARTNTHTRAVPTFRETGIDNWSVDLVLGAGVIEVEIDIKPGGDPASAQCRARRGVVPVAVLSDADFDATTLDAGTVRFGKNGDEAAEAHRKRGDAKRHVEDVNDDGMDDMVFHFRFDETGFSCDDVPAGERDATVEGTLTGETVDGDAVEGADDLRLVAGGEGRGRGRGR